MASELAKLLQKPEPEKVVVELPALLSGINMAGLGADLFPRASATNALATDGTKQKSISL